ncbi:unnamed protein product [Protopolystoma xenopodis]|uniref:Uncharacterized protein n=1 Tax=Protopolystoma xenopodis TaxID=117903 RepID=A0A448XK33_9PLAT|nr:unnamed protein product [Protopolystoma xenopodis]
MTSSNQRGAVVEFLIAHVHEIFPLDTPIRLSEIASEDDSRLLERAEQKRRQLQPTPDGQEAGVDATGSDFIKIGSLFS